MDLYAPDVTVGHGIPELVHIEVFGAAPGVEIAAAKVDGVGAVLYGGPQGLHRPRRG